MKEENELTTIQLTKTLRDAIKEEMSKTDTYETFLRKMLTAYKKAKDARLRRQYVKMKHTK